MIGLPIVIRAVHFFFWTHHPCIAMMPGIKVLLSQKFEFLTDPLLGLNGVRKCKELAPLIFKHSFRGRGNRFIRKHHFIEILKKYLDLMQPEVIVPDLIGKRHL
jgi:hypothetical protein